MQLQPDKWFGDVKDIPDSRQIIDDAPTMGDIFIDDELFSDTNTKDTKNLVDIITQEADVNYILFDHVPIDTTPNVSPPPDPSLNFSDVFKKQRKKSRCKKISKKYKKTRKKKGQDKRINKKSY